jgi:hypothetical protein
MPSFPFICFSKTHHSLLLDTGIPHLDFEQNKEFHSLVGQLSSQIESEISSLGGSMKYDYFRPSSFL